MVLVLTHIGRSPIKLAAPAALLTLST